MCFHNIVTYVSFPNEPSDFYFYLESCFHNSMTSLFFKRQYTHCIDYANDSQDHISYKKKNAAILSPL